MFWSYYVYLPQDSKSIYFLSARNLAKSWGRERNKSIIRGGPAVQEPQSSRKDKTRSHLIRLTGGREEGAGRRAVWKREWEAGCLQPTESEYEVLQPRGESGAALRAWRQTENNAHTHEGTESSTLEQRQNMATSHHLCLSFFSSSHQTENVSTAACPTYLHSPAARSHVIWPQLPAPVSAPSSASHSDLPLGLQMHQAWAYLRPCFPSTRNTLPPGPVGFAASHHQISAHTSPSS